MSDYIVDASVACKWLWNEEFTEESDLLLKGGHHLFAPDLFVTELHSAILKRVRWNDLDPKDADGCRRQLRTLPIQYHKTPPLADAAYELTRRAGVSFYDGLYLALAVLNDMKVVTADRKFYNSLSKGPLRKYICWIGKVA